MSDLRYVVESLDGPARTYKTMAETARAVLDCSGRCAPVGVVIDHAKTRSLTATELARLGQAVRDERSRPSEPTQAGVARLVQAITNHAAEAA